MLEEFQRDSVDLAHGEIGHAAEIDGTLALSASRPSGSGGAFGAAGAFPFIAQKSTKVAGDNRGRDKHGPADTAPAAGSLAAPLMAEN